MQVLIETIETNSQQLEAARVRYKVFGQEWRCKVADPWPAANRDEFHLLARIYPGAEAVAALSVIETTNEIALHSSFGLRFDAGARVARYTQLAVLKPFRGLRIALSLLGEAHRRFVVPQAFDYTWLLFDADRAHSCSLRRSLGFSVSSGVIRTSYGRMRALVRAEGDAMAERVPGRAGSMTFPSVEPDRSAVGAT